MLLQFAYNLSNATVTSLLRFFKIFIRELGIAFQCQPLVLAFNNIPVRLVTVHSLFGIKEKEFINNVVCPKCHSIYNYEDCVNRSRSHGGLISKLCKHIAYPNHPHKSRRTPCDTLLLKTVKTKHGISLQPFKKYPYRSLRSSMASLVSRASFLDKCEKWRNRLVRVPPSL